MQAPQVAFSLRKSHLQESNQEHGYSDSALDESGFAGQWTDEDVRERQRFVAALETAEGLGGVLRAIQRAEHRQG
jgi:hypothetical protein